MQNTYSSPLFKGVFFDLDGTLADTAPDLVAAANRLRSARGLTELPYPELRPRASAGARGLIKGAFGFDPEHPEFNNLRDEFLKNYAQHICVHSKLFDGMDELLILLEEQQIAWGIVTNKVGYLTNPLLKLMGLDQRSQANISGDTTPHAKPHPAPVLMAAELCGIDPKHCLYVGDDLRDVEAGRAAGMKTVAAAYGYCGCDEPVTSWGADFIIHHPRELQAIIFSK